MTFVLDLPMSPDSALLEQYRQVLAGWPVPNTQLTLATRSGETFVVACGDERAPPLVLLHGAQANAATWMFDTVSWSRHFRVFAVDLVGECGLSAPARPPLQGDAYANWLDDVLNGLGIARASLVGMSFGGWVATDYAARRPHRVAQLALICPGGIGRQKNFLVKALPLLLLGRWGEARMLRMVMGPEPAQVPELVRPLLALMERIRKTVRPRTEPMPIVDDAALQSLRMPLLAIVGAKDPLLDSFETMRRLARHVPHAEVRFLPEGHHFLPGQQEPVLRFLLGALAAAA
jgi:pimeloyl-ACP methyl ester carboxylesterase